ncbi:transglutaminase domain-containing protein [Thermococcus nautili]|uniref:Transglutaminase-like enzyme, putative cysteine protease n=1 Tax=Thermococcus nautili TaxID=195522 RepID=W8NUJ3_9EURY|nr:transglutaminase domain-containing protein [Thermococcus nautili]AHL22807.1 Transglutaminase-like enzyme, putative cysteine protease [Thermococcus nautili]
MPLIKKTKREKAVKGSKSIRGILVRWLILSLLLVVGLSLVLFVVPGAYEVVRGDEITRQVLSQLETEADNPNQMAIKIHKWEQENFLSPYSINPKDLSFFEQVLAGWGFYENKEGEIHLFRPGFGLYSVPPQWVLHSKLANCKEYAEVFVYLMNKAGFKARVVRAPGEDHTWAEYYIGSYKIIFDPSNPVNPVIVNPKSFGERRHFSYVEAYDLQNPNQREDVSDEYIERGILVVEVVRDNRPVSGATVEVLSMYLMERYPERYKKPRPVISNKTHEDGLVQFKLGPNNYTLVAKKCSLLVCWKGEVSGNVSVGKSTHVLVELHVDYLNTGLRGVLVLGVLGVVLVKFRKRYWGKLPK